MCLRGYSWNTAALFSRPSCMPTQFTPDPLRGGAGGSAATGRKRNESFLKGLQALLAKQDTEEAEAPADDESDSLYRSLQAMVQNRPQNLPQELRDLVSKFSNKDMSSSPTREQRQQSFHAKERGSEKWHTANQWDHYGAQTSAPRKQYAKNAWARSPPQDTPNTWQPRAQEWEDAANNICHTIQEYVQ